MSDPVQFLFAYGTLKSSHPEHAEHAARPLSIQPATACGYLWKLKEGYPILQIDPALAIADATDRAVEDWTLADTRARSGPAPQVQGRWIEGELLAYPLSNDALDPMDAWEGFTPGQRGVYQRRVIRVRDATGSERIAWAYVCFSPPNWATMLNATSW